MRPEPYHYKACGLEGIYLLNGYTVEEHDGERHVFVENVDELHKAIGRHIISKRKGLTGAEIRFLRNTLDTGHLGRQSSAHARCAAGVNGATRCLASTLSNNSVPLTAWAARGFMT